MNYTREQLEAMPDLPGSTENAKLKIETELTQVRVWLLRNYSVTGDRYEVLIERHQSDKGWLAIKRYPA